MVLPASVHVSMQSGCPVVIAIENEALSSAAVLAAKALGKVVGHQGTRTGVESGAEGARSLALLSHRQSCPFSDFLSAVSTSKLIFSIFRIYRVNSEG